MFKNEPLTDFTIAEERKRFQAALDEVDASIRAKKFTVYPIIGGKEIKTGDIIKSVDPSDKEIVVGEVHMAASEHATLALKAAYTSASSWEHLTFQKRAEIIQQVGAKMRAKKHYLSAIMVREGGKPWRESDADVAEAIDFCDYYAQEMLRLGPPTPTAEVPGEESVHFYQPRGVAVIISPWNFPLAITCGMTVAALVTGNTAVLKPSNQTCVIASEFAKILYQAGVPPQVFSFVPGRGRDIGRVLVDSPLVDMICFTGSKEVGLEIINRAAQVHPGQKSVKRVVAEMGGKNAVIVDEDADLDETIRGVLYSAFGYAGQKCSACSRLIVVGDAYEPLMQRLSEAASDIIVGRASDPSTLLCPVIDNESQKRILSTIEQGKLEAKLLFQGKVPDHGFFVPPTIFRDAKPGTSLWEEEIFGPVLACMQATDFNQALELANNSQYALTGGVFSRSPFNIEQARKRFKVGNLYINRGCTGALVCRHPFGGFKMSGVGSKAGGFDYLLQFMEPRTVTENTLRRGFAPESK